MGRSGNLPGRFLGGLGLALALRLLVRGGLGMDGRDAGGNQRAEEKDCKLDHASEEDSGRNHEEHGAECDCSEEGQNGNAGVLEATHRQRDEDGGDGDLEDSNASGVELEAGRERQATGSEHAQKLEPDHREDCCEEDQNDALPDEFRSVCGAREFQKILRKGEEYVFEVHLSVLAF